MTEEELQAIEARLAAATEGPYNFAGLPYNGGDDPEIFSETVLYREGSIFEGEGLYLAQTVYDMQSGTQVHDIEADTIFFAHSWQDIKDLLAYVRSLETALEKIPGILNNPSPSYIQDVIDLVETSLATE